MDMELPTGVTDAKGEAIFIRYRDIPDYVNEDFFEAYQWWVLSKVMEVPPYSSGWMDWPSVAVAVTAAFNLEQKTMEREEREAND